MVAGAVARIPEGNPLVAVDQEISLDRKLVDRRIWPAIDINRSGTRREEMLMDPEEHRRVCILRRVLDDMNDTLRVPLLLRDMDEMSYQEIADALGVGLSAVKMRIKRARQEFRKRYRETMRPVADEV